MPCASYQCNSAQRILPDRSRTRPLPFILRQRPFPYNRRRRGRSRILDPTAITSGLRISPMSSKSMHLEFYGHATVRPTPRSDHMERPAPDRSIRGLVALGSGNQSRIRKEPVMGKGITFVGLDAHKETISVAMLLPGAAKATEWQSSSDKASVCRMLRKIRRETPGDVRFCYEAGPCGYALQRWIRESKFECVVVAPSLIPRKAG